MEFLGSNIVLQYSPFERYSLTPLQMCYHYRSTTKIPVSLHHTPLPRCFPLPLVTLILQSESKDLFSLGFLCSKALSLYIPYVSEIIWFLSFSWLISLSVTLSNFIHIVTNGQIIAYSGLQRFYWKLCWFSFLHIALCFSLADCRILYIFSFFPHFNYNVGWCVFSWIYLDFRNMGICFLPQVGDIFGSYFFK